MYGIVEATPADPAIRKSRDPSAMERDGGSDRAAAVGEGRRKMLMPRRTSEATCPAFLGPGIEHGARAWALNLDPRSGRAGAFKSAGKVLLSSQHLSHGESRRLG